MTWRVERGECISPKEDAAAESDLRKQDLFVSLSAGSGLVVSAASAVASELPASVTAADVAKTFAVNDDRLKTKVETNGDLVGSGVSVVS